MTIELPVLRLGLAGFAADEQAAVHRVVHSGVGETTSWELAHVDHADALWLNGARTQLAGKDRIRVAPGIPTEKALQIHLPDVDRPVAFARPLPPRLVPLCSFDLTSAESMGSALAQFETWLQPLIAQFCLASHIMEHQAALGAGRFELHLNSGLLAVVDMHGDASVRAGATPEEFEGAMWRTSTRTVLPEDFVSTSLSRLMWQYATRTTRDVLPRHYRTGLLYYRRPPRLSQRLVDDAHLLVMRELMIIPATFAELQQRCGCDERRMSQLLGALYLVGSITSNPKRAAPASRPPGDGERSFPSQLPSSGLDSLDPHGEAGRRKHSVHADLTAPAPLRPDH